MNISVTAKSQDVVVLLKWLSMPTLRTYAEMAGELGMSVGEVHGASRRASEAGLFDLKAKRPRVSALLEYLLHGVKYAFPARRGAPTRGMPTSYAAPPLCDQLQQEKGKDLSPVWPDAEGKVRGYALEPLFSNVPYAARRDSKLYELLALVDALREGRARERNMAASELRQRLESLGEAQTVSE